MTIITNPLVFIVEGIAGAGKTNFLAFIRTSTLALKYAIYVVESPTEKWQNTHGVDLLHLFHLDPQRYSFSFVSWVLSTRSETLRMHMQRCLNVNDTRPIVTFVERSLLTDIECWASTVCEHGMMNAWELEVLRTQCKHLLSTIPAPNGIIMLNTPIDITLRCITTRRRVGEGQTITHQFQQDMQAKYHDWLKSVPYPRIYVDTVATFHQQPASYMAITGVLNTVDDFITRLYTQLACSSSLIRSAIQFNVLTDDEDSAENS